MTPSLSPLLFPCETDSCQLIPQDMQLGATKGRGVQGVSRLLKAQAFSLTLIVQQVVQFPSGNTVPGPWTSRAIYLDQRERFFVTRQ